MKNYFRVTAECGIKIPPVGCSRCGWENVGKFCGNCGIKTYLSKTKARSGMRAPRRLNQHSAIGDTKMRFEIIKALGNAESAVLGRLSDAMTLMVLEREFSDDGKFTASELEGVKPRAAQLTALAFNAFIEVGGDAIPEQDDHWSEQLAEKCVFDATVRIAKDVFKDGRVTRDEQRGFQQRVVDLAKPKFDALIEMRGAVRGGSDEGGLFDRVDRDISVD